MVYDPKWPESVTAEQASWRLRAMHYSTLSIVHGFDELDSGGLNETINRWMQADLNLRLVLDARLPVSPTYASQRHTGFEYVRDHLGYRLELCTASFASDLWFGSIEAASVAPPNFNATVVNWGFSAPINPRPVYLVLLSPDRGTIVWQSPESLADVRDWQPHFPGDPTYTPLRHTFGTAISGVDPNRIPSCKNSAVRFGHCRPADFGSFQLADYRRCVLCRSV